jgi:uncharacterized membrane protein required for colicin V production
MRRTYYCSRLGEGIASSLALSLTAKEVASPLSSFMEALLVGNGARAMLLFVALLDAGQSFFFVFSFGFTVFTANLLLEWVLALALGLLKTRPCSFHLSLVVHMVSFLDRGRLPLHCSLWMFPQIGRYRGISELTQKLV